MTDPTTILPLSADDLTFWRTEIERAETQRRDVIAQWDVVGNLERYTPTTVMTASRVVDARVNVAKDFSDVERKKAALFYDTPAIALVPDPGTNPVALLLHQELLNQLLSGKRMNAKATVLPTILNCLVAIQPVPTEIGYTAVTEQVEQSVPQMDPMTGQPAVDPMTGQPVMTPQLVPVTVWEEFFWKPISPKAQLLPVSHKNTRYDEAPWLGHRWRLPVSQVRRRFQLPEDWTGGDGTDDRPYFDTLGEGPDPGEPMVSGWKLWYRASLRDPQVSHPELIRELELVDGHDQPVVHRNCPYQEIGPDGRLTANSMTGYPQHPLALRDLTDAAYVAADCTLTGPLTRELNKFRTQIVQRRDGARLHFFYDTELVNEEMRQKIEQNQAPTMIPAESGALARGKDQLMLQVPSLELGRESYLGQDVIERDRDGILGLSANQMNPGSQGGKTATEISTVQRNTEARFEQERQRVLEWWIRGVQKLSAIVLRYGDRVAADVLGAQRGQAWVSARDQGLYAGFGFDVVIDSGSYIDIEARKRQTLQLYNMTAKDPTLNRGIVQARLATDFGLDPSQWIVSKPPEEKPDAPTVSISVKPEDLDPALPSYVGTYAILTAGGVKGLPPPQPVAIPGGPVGPQTPDHGGMAELTPRLNQHQMDESGQQPGPAVN